MEKEVGETQKLNISNSRREGEGRGGGNKGGWREGGKRDVIVDKTQ